MQKLTSLLCFVAIASVLLWGVDSKAIAQSDSLPERPDTQQLLPETTVGLIKIRDLRDFVEKMKGSSAGRLWESDSVKPLVDSIYEKAVKQFDNVKEEVGLSLEEIQSLPSGEITIALIAPRRKDMAYVVMLETDEDNEAVEKALDRGRELLEAKTSGEEGDEESDSDINIEKIMISGRPAYFTKHEGMLIGSSSRQELEDIFTRWAGGEVEKVRPLAENRKFTRIAKRCAVSNEALPDMRFFLDPIGIFKSSARGSTAMQFGVSMLPTLGLDGVLAAGGNMYVGQDDYESIGHAHLLLASPKEGLLNALALKPEEYTPEPWVPIEIAQYMTTSWDVPQMLDSIKEISDQISEGSFDKFFLDRQNDIKRLNLELDIRTDLIDYLSGRITVVRPILSGSEINGIGNVISLGLNDAAKFEENFRTFMEAEKVSEGWSEQEHGDVKYWRKSDSAIKAAEESLKKRLERLKKRAEKKGLDTDRPKLDVRKSQRAFGIIGDQFVASDSTEFMEFAIDTFNGNKPALAEDEDFLKHADKMTKLLKSDLPAAVFYFDSPRQIEFYLKALEEDSLMTVIDDKASNDDSGLIADIKASIDEHGFPAIEDIEQYLSTSGGFVTADDSGYHLLFFQERVE